MRRLCHGREACDITANDAYMSAGKTHCPGVDKYAIVTYRCQPSVEVGTYGRADRLKLFSQEEPGQPTFPCPVGREN